jgi:hypothetical protein
MNERINGSMNDGHYDVSTADVIYRERGKRMIKHDL